VRRTTTQCWTDEVREIASSAFFFSGTVAPLR
jgi:hypothetical protein